MTVEDLPDYLRKAWPDIRELMGGDEEGTLATLTAHRTELIEPCIAEHRGRVVKTTGDGLLAEFTSVV